MMSIKEKIINDKKIAMKNGNTEQKLILSTVLGELDRISKTTTNEQVIKIIKKIVDSNIECGDISDNKYIEIYLPKMIDTEVLKEIIMEEMTRNEYNSMKDMGKIMSFLKTHYAGQYDGKLASDIIKNYLK